MLVQSTTIYEWASVMQKGTEGTWMGFGLGIGKAETLLDIADCENNAKWADMAINVIRAKKSCFYSTLPFLISCLFLAIAVNKKNKKALNTALKFHVMGSFLMISSLCLLAHSVLKVKAAAELLLAQP